MAVTVNYYNDYFEQLQEAVYDHEGGSFKVMLFTSGFAFDKTDDFVDDVDADEVASGGGYTTGGEALTTTTVTQDDTNDRADVDFDNPEWTSSTITASDAVLYLVVGSAATDNLWLHIDFGGNQSTTGTTLRIELDAVGIQSLQSA